MLTPYLSGDFDTFRFSWYLMHWLLSSRDVITQAARLVAQQPAKRRTGSRFPAPFRRSYPSISTLDAVPRTRQAATRAFFGATVRYANASGVERVVSIGGTDEVDLARNHISWVSPLGRALLKSAAGDSVVLQAPGGTEYLDVLEVCYERISVEPLREPPVSESSSKGPSRRPIPTDEG